MQDTDFETKDSEVAKKQLAIIRIGLASFTAEGETVLAEEDLTALEVEGYAALPLNKQYWIRRCYERGISLKKRQEDTVRKTLSQPATLGHVRGFIYEMLYGEGGIKAGLDEWSAGINHYVLLMGEALRLKGLLTPEDIEAAENSLQEKAKVDAEKAEKEAKEFLEAATGEAPEEKSNEKEI